MVIRLETPAPDLRDFARLAVDCEESTQRFKNDLPLIPTRRKKRRDKKLNRRELSALVDLIRNNAILYLDELRDAVRRKTGTYVKGAPGASSLELPIVRRHALRKI